MIIVRIINTYAFWDLSGQLNLVININFYLSVQISCSNFHLEENWVPFERNELIKIKFSAKIKCGLSNCLKKCFNFMDVVSGVPDCAKTFEISALPHFLLIRDENWIFRICRLIQYEIQIWPLPQRISGCCLSEEWRQ